MRTHSVHPLCLAVLALTACVAGSSPTPQPPTVVVVENHNWSDMNVYALRDGLSIRLGTVTSMRSARFRVPSDLVTGSSSMRLVADPIGAMEAFTTGPILLQPGQTISFTIQNNLAISDYAVWDR